LLKAIVLATVSRLISTFGAAGGGGALAVAGGGGGGGGGAGAALADGAVVVSSLFFSSQPIQIKSEAQMKAITRMAFLSFFEIPVEAGG
jgi:hypothetical protein